MLFVEPRFFLFFGLVFGLYWLLRSDRWRKPWLLLASYVFYGAWDWRFLALIGLSTVVDWAIGVSLQRTNEAHARDRLMLTSLTLNLGVLFAFKYFNFFADSTVQLLTALGLEANWTTLHIILPVGISFYTFQSLSYTIDVYRRELPARQSLLDFALFVAFFPQLVAGPIVRASTFLPQLDRERWFGEVPIRACVTLFLIGYFKKACVADNIAPFVDPVFARPELWTGPSIIGAVMLYAVQIYGDFSGYSDMAIATAGLLGYRLPRNFDAPYLSASITEFWHRWHISLSTWLRDYLYIPLGGNRHGALMRYRNLLLTMVLGGLWHGASWNFVIWGTLHGVALAAHRLWRDSIAARLPALPGRILPAAALVASIAMTFALVTLAWVFFRAPDLSSAVQMIGRGLSLTEHGRRSLGPWVWPTLAVLLALQWACWRVRPERLVETLPPTAFAAGLGVAAAIALALLPAHYKPFVYFQF
jgi:D-alanyl-lipoteichoic acid acyltransferase DltB (MBOAT superfamily)